jgi:hypothetical protein
MYLWKLCKSPTEFANSLEYNFGVTDLQNAYQDFPKGGYVNKHDTIFTPDKGKNFIYFITNLKNGITL